MVFWNKLTYQHKTILFAGLFLLLLFVSYQKKISPTLQQKSQLKELEQLANNNTLQEEIGLLESELHYLNKVLGKDRKDLESINREILNYVSMYSDSTEVELVQMPKAHSVSEQGFTIYTHIVTLKGDFKPLLFLAHFFETRTSGMKLASVRYFSKINMKTKRKELFAELYIQSYEKNT